MNYVKLFLIVIVCTAWGCNKEKSIQGKSSIVKTAQNCMLLETKDVFLNNTLNKVIVYRFYEKPSFINTPGTISIKGPVQGEFVVIEIIGKINKVDHILVEWDGEKLHEKGILHTFENIENRKIILDTYFTEGSPNNKIRIVDIHNNKYEIEFNETNLEGTGCTVPNNR